ncbi:hypothetical protein D3C81_1505960 [compost metagenome]
MDCPAGAGQSIAGFLESPPEHAREPQRRFGVVHALAMDGVVDQYFTALVFAYPVFPNLEVLHSASLKMLITRIACHYAAPAHTAGVAGLLTWRQHRNRIGVSILIVVPRWRHLYALAVDVEEKGRGEERVIDAVAQLDGVADGVDDLDPRHLKLQEARRSDLLWRTFPGGKGPGPLHHDGLPACHAGELRDLDDEKLVAVEVVMNVKAASRRSRDAQQAGNNRCSLHPESQRWGSPFVLAV